MTDRCGAVGMTYIGSKNAQFLVNLRAVALRTGDLGVGAHQKFEIASAAGAFILKYRHLFGSSLR